MKAGKFFLAISIIIFTASNSFPQWLDKIQTDSDWEDSYNQGYYDYDSYLLYREMSEGKAVDDTSEYIINTLGNSLSETASLDSLPGSDQDSIHVLPRARLRTGQTISEDNNSGYTLVSSNWHDVFLEYKERNRNESWYTDRRSLNFSVGKSSFSMGNYTPNIGLGLGIGRYDFRPLSVDPAVGNSDEFIYPLNSLYNGFKISYSDKISILYSRKKYDNTYKDFAGASISTSYEGREFGITASAASLNAGNSRTTFGATSIYLIDKKSGLGSEIGYAESGIGLCMRYRRYGYDIKLWHYDDSYLNLQSSSTAHSDYTIYEDAVSGLSFRQPQRGETGAFLAKRLTAGRFGFVLSSEIWKRSPEENIAIDNSFGARYAFGKTIGLFSKYFQRTGGINPRIVTDAGIDLHRKIKVIAASSIWIENDLVDKSRSIYYIYSAVPVYSRFLVSARLRWKYSGAFDYFIEEKTSIAENLWIKVTYRWRSSYRSRMGPLYLVLESSI